MSRNVPPLLFPATTYTKRPVRSVCCGTARTLYYVNPGDPMLPSPSVSTKKQTIVVRRPTPSLHNSTARTGRPWRRPRCRDSPEINARKPLTVRPRRDWIMLFVVMVDVNREPPDLVAEPPATVLSHQDWIIRFVVMGSVNGASTKIIVVKIVIVE